MGDLELEEEELQHISAKRYQDSVMETDINDPKYELITKGIRKVFPCTNGFKHVLDDFSLKIEKGKIFGLLGPNGAGKTTFLGVITGMLKPEEGEGMICGHSIQDISKHSGEIGFCP